MAAHQQCCGVMFWAYLLISACLVAFAGLMSGLTLGLMSLSLVDLEVLLQAGQPKDRDNAAKILPVVKNQHLLLCTLLIGNSLAMEALPIFLDTLVPSWGAILISVTLILAFGEIIPQAVCSRYGLTMGAKAAPLVRVLLIIFFPVSYPISKLLDCLLGKGHFALMRRAELRTLVDMHGNEAGKGGELTHDETTIITGALDMTQKTAKDAMTSISDTFSLDINAKLDLHTMSLIMTKGHSRIPIYSGSPTNVIGLILVKNLITCRPEDEIPIRTVTLRKIPRVFDDLPLYDILNEFQKGHSHMAVVVKRAQQMGDTLESKPTGSEHDTLQKDNQLVGIPGEGSLSVSSEISGINSATNGASGIRPPVKKFSAENNGEPRTPSKKLDRGRKNNILDVNEDSLPSYSSDEEVLGIITMEDVMEELLQEEIFDETDEYVDVHNKIKINMLPPGKSSPTSPGHASAPNFQRRTPTASPLSPYHQHSVVRSPVSPSHQAAASMLSRNSAGKSFPTSPSSLHVSRKLYERIEKIEENKEDSLV